MVIAHNRFYFYHLLIYPLMLPVILFLAIEN